MPTQTRWRRSGSGLAPAPPPTDAVFIGDAAGEYRLMRRGLYRAWAHVAVAFTEEVCFLSYGMYALLHLTKLGQNADATVLVATAAGVALSIWVFYDRWRCIEAFSSRFGFNLRAPRLVLWFLDHIAMIWVPQIAFVYANYRGLRKLLGS